MSISITSWNVETRLSAGMEDARSRRVRGEVARLGADIVLFPEVYDGPRGIHSDAEATFGELGYGEVIDFDYADHRPLGFDRISEALTFRAMSRIALTGAEVISLAGIRNAIHLETRDPSTGDPVHVYGLHLDDRRIDWRMAQIESLAESIAQHKGEATIVGGDFNSVTGKGLAPLMRHEWVRWAAHNIMPTRGLRSMAIRTVEMSSGQELHVLSGLTGLRNVDPEGAPTTSAKVKGLEWVPSWPLLDLDHFFVTDNVQVDGFEIMPYDGGSDHRAITMIGSFTYTL